MFKEMSMNLREWGSNSQTLRNLFKKEDHFDGKEMKVLGTTWMPIAFIHQLKNHATLKSPQRNRF